MNVSIPYTCLLSIEKSLKFNHSLLEIKSTPGLREEVSTLKDKTKNGNIERLREDISKTSKAKI